MGIKEVMRKFGEVRMGLSISYTSTPEDRTFSYSGKVDDFLIIVMSEESCGPNCLLEDVVGPLFNPVKVRLSIINVTGECLFMSGGPEINRIDGEVLHDFLSSEGWKANDIDKWLYSKGGLSVKPRLKKVMLNGVEIKVETLKELIALDEAVNRRKGDN